MNKKPLSKKYIVLSPLYSNANIYIDILRETYQRLGFETIGYNEAFKKETYAKTEIFHFNWFENLIGVEYFTEFLKRLCLLFILKLVKGKRIIWTFHNRRPHNGQDFISATLFRSLLYSSDIIIVHSKISKKILDSYRKGLSKKAVYVPHPNYIERYGPIKKIDLCEKKLKLLFFGMVKPYKNIELLLKVASCFSKEDLEMTIMGKTQDNEYREKLEAHCPDNVNLELDFIENDRLPDSFAKCDLVILPYDLRSSLNSGTVLLAFSYKKTVICPDIGTILDIPKRDFVLNYTYTSHDDHFLKLREMIEKALVMKMSDYKIFNRFGESMYKYVETFHSNEVFQKTLIQATLKSAH